jgi:hypothetical protein
MDWFQRGVGAFVLIIDTVYILICDLVSQTVIGSYGIKKDCNCNDTKLESVQVRLPAMA